MENPVDFRSPQGGCDALDDDTPGCCKLLINNEVQRLPGVTEAACCREAFRRPARWKWAPGGCD